MSIIIKGIDLPKKIKAQHQHSSEYECETYIELYIRSDGVAFDDEFEEVGQAIQIDRPHGRIKDIDKIKDKLRDQIPAYGLDGTYRVSNAFDEMDNAPTILEAEE